MRKEFNNDLNRELVIIERNASEFKIPRFLKNNRYEVIDLLAVGGVGIIIVAKDTHLENKKVLIKRALYKKSMFKNSKDNSRNQKIKENRYNIKYEYTSMTHGWARNIPSIPIPLDYFTDINPEIYGPHVSSKNETFFVKDLYKEEPYLVINYFTGEPLKANADVLNRNRMEFVEFYIKTIANILVRFHTPYKTQIGEFKFYYCDLKPNNVIYTDDKQLVLIDMGSFAIMVDDDLQNSITTTPGYSAPEIENRQPMYLSPAVDVYALAMSAFELITGKGPVLDANKRVKLDWNIFEDVVRKAKADHWLSVFQKALEPYPDDRYPNLEEFVSELCKEEQISLKSQKHNIDLSYSIKLEDDWFRQKKGYRKKGRKANQKIEDNILSYNVQNNMTYFSKPALCTEINTNIKLSDTEKCLNKDLYDKCRKNLTQNYTFLPELIVKGKGSRLISYQSPLENNEVIKKNFAPYLLRLIEFFITLQDMEFKILGLAENSIGFDKLRNPFINDFWILAGDENNVFLENPKLQEILGSKYIICPEVKQNRTWMQDKSFAYYAGIAILLIIDKNNTKKLYEAGKLFNKNDYEAFVNSLMIGVEMKDILLNLISHQTNARISLPEARKKLNNDKYTPTDSQQASNKTLLIEYTTRAQDYEIDYKELFKTADRKSFDNADKYVFLYESYRHLTEPVYQNKRFKVYPYTDESFVYGISSVVNDHLNMHPNSDLIFITTANLNSIKNEIEEEFAKFRNVYLFANTRLEIDSNVKYFALDDYRIEKKGRSNDS